MERGQGAGDLFLSHLLPEVLPRCHTLVICLALVCCVVKALQGFSRVSASFLGHFPHSLAPFGMWFMKLGPSAALLLWVPYPRTGSPGFSRPIADMPSPPSSYPIV